MQSDHSPQSCPLYVVHVLPVAMEVGWRVAGRDRSRSFMTQALADSYRTELIRAARRGQAFDPATGEPAGTPSTPNGAPALLHRTQAPSACWPGWSGSRCRSATSATRTLSGQPWTGCAHGWTARPRRRTRSPASGRCSTALSATPLSWGCCPPTPSAWAGARRKLPWPSARLRSPARRRSGRS
jgi:hypothetical protein